jgi:SAM-dependent methyltransferase
MTVFGSYSRYYDLLYRDKDYEGEARFVRGVVAAHTADPRSVLELGCGTGQHGRHLAALGLRVHGVDRSEEMVHLALNRRALLAANVADNLTFTQGDVRFVDTGATFDAVISLFHVVSYQSTNHDIMAMFHTAKKHLRHGGVFVFDCWYGPAVLTERPETRVKRLENETIRVTRIAEPKLYPNDNCVDVNYHVFITDKSSGAVEEVRETHRMRYLFRPEVDLFAHIAGLEIIETGEWITSAEPGFATWGVYFVARA